MSFEQVLSQVPGDVEAVQSEVHVLRSRELMQRTAEHLNLVDVPEFNPSIGEPGPLDSVKSWLNGVVKALSNRTPSAPPVCS